MPSRSSQQLQLQGRVTEGMPVDAFVADVKEYIRLVSNYTQNELARLRFSFKQDSKLFNINNISGVIQTARVLDREALCSRSITCNQSVVVVVRPIQFYALVQVLLAIDDVNDNIPTFPRARVFVEVPEKAPVGTLIGEDIPSADDEDSGLFGNLQYRLLEDFGLFELKVIDLVDGSQLVRLRLTSQLDGHSVYNLTVVAADGGTPSHMGYINITVITKASTELRPTFDKEIYEVEITETAPIMQSVVQVQAHDLRDTTERMVYDLVRDELSTTTTSDLFGIDSDTGVVYVNGNIDYERDRYLTLTVSATLAGRPSSDSVFAQIHMQVFDVNDNAPSIVINTLTTSRRGEVVENAQAGTFVAHVVVTDADDGVNGRSSCSVDNASPFVLETMFGSEYKISTTLAFDRERTDEYSVKLTCRDEGMPSLISVVQLGVDVLDVNDNSPRLSRDLYTTTVEENNPLNSTVIIINATDKDIGKNSELKFSLSSTDSSSASVLYINPSTGEIVTNFVFDYEKRRRYTFVVTVVDGGYPQLSATSNLILNVKDVNDNVPRFVRRGYAFNTTKGAQIGTLVGQVSAVDDDVSLVHRSITYSVEKSNDYLYLDPDSGEVFTTNVFDKVEVFQFGVRASNYNQSAPRPYDSINVTITVGNHLPVFLFPRTNNNTVQILVDAERGHVVANVMVLYDHPSYLRYNIVDGNMADMFTIDTLTGCIRTDGKIISTVVSHLRISVFDINESSDQIVADLWIVPTMAEAEILVESQSLVHSGDRLVIIVGIVCGTVGLFLVVIFTLIAFLKYRRKRNSTRGSQGCSRANAFGSNMDNIYNDEEDKANCDVIKDISFGRPCRPVDVYEDEYCGLQQDTSCGKDKTPVKKEVTFRLDNNSLCEKHALKIPLDISHQRFNVNTQVLKHNLYNY